MSFPSIPGYTAPTDSIGDYFDRPDGKCPDELWPKSYLMRLTPFPDGWVTVAESTDTPGVCDVGTSSVLVEPNRLESALVQPSWSGHSIGSAGFWEDANGRRFADGLTDDEFGGVVTEFFVQARHHYQLDEPSIEIALPFLWFFDAVPDGEGWSSLDRDGHLQPLVRVERPTIGSYRVQCAAGQLRRYLRAADRVLLTQHDVRRFRSLSRILRHERATCSV